MTETDWLTFRSEHRKKDAAVAADLAPLQHALTEAAFIASGLSRNLFMKTDISLLFSSQRLSTTYDAIISLKTGDIVG